MSPTSPRTVPKEPKQIAKESSTTMSALSLCSAYIDALAFDLFSDSLGGSPKFIEHHTVKIDDSPTYTAILTVKSPKSYNIFEHKEIEEIKVTSRRTDWPDEVEVNDCDVRNKALEGLCKELQKRRLELTLNQLNGEIARLEEQKKMKERLRVMKELELQYLKDQS